MKASNLVAASVMVLAGMAWSSSASALPSFARQTQMACASCHTQFPELTHFGRDFKLHGYTLITQPTVEDTSKTSGGSLSLGAYPPISAMMQISYTSTRKAQPDSAIASSNAQNGSVLFPQQLSLFYAGRISPKIGSFIQFTYDGNEDSTSIDNTDIRFSDGGSLGDLPVTYGLTLNNNPTVQDLWNSTPAWGIPYASSPIAPSPAAATLLDGTLGQQVGGIGPYAAIHFGQDMLYSEMTLYRAAQPGHGLLDSSQTDNAVVKGWAPYLRGAFEHDWGGNSWEVGLLAMNADTTAAGLPVDSSRDKRKDLGVDTQYQQIEGDRVYSVNAIYIREKQDWAAGGTAANASDTLKTFKIAGSYYYNRTYGGYLQYFQTTGDADTGLYAPGTAGTVTGSANGKPDSKGFRVEAMYTPWENTRFALQYTAYSKFNGDKNNYDGLGRSAKDNNTLYLLSWFMW
jgi:hypothetical protein